GVCIGASRAFPPEDRRDDRALSRALRPGRRWEMILNLLIAPDFAPEHFAGWHMLNTLMQKKTGLHMHLMTPASPGEQAELIASGKVDLVYANPFDSAPLVREAGFRALARPVRKPNEMVIATRADSPLEALEDLKAGTRI